MFKRIKLQMGNFCWLDGQLVCWLVWKMWKLTQHLVHCAPALVSKIGNGELTIIMTWTHS
jgi:hypothetical protein